MDVRFRATATSRTKLFDLTPTGMGARARPHTTSEDSTQQAPFLDRLASQGGKVPPSHRQIHPIFGPAP
eukprot:6111302-Pyramimonas_sp.AAC.1